MQHAVGWWCCVVHMWIFCWRQKKCVIAIVARIMWVCNNMFRSWSWSMFGWGRVKVFWLLLLSKPLLHWICRTIETDFQHVSFGISCYNEDKYLLNRDRRLLLFGSHCSRLKTLNKFIKTKRTICHRLLATRWQHLQYSVQCCFYDCLPFYVL